MNNSSRQDFLPIVFSSPPFQFFSLVILFTAIYYDQTALAVFAMFLLIMSGGALMWSRYGLRGLHCVLHLKSVRIFPGESLEFSITADNSKYLPVWIKLDVRVDQPLVSAGTNIMAQSVNPKAASEPSLPEMGNIKNSFSSPCKTILHGEGLLFGKQKAPLKWILTPRERGIYKIGPAYLKAGDLLGLFSQEVELDKNNYVTVYPKLAVLNNIQSPLSELYGFPGAKSPVVDPVYPVATREYHPGNPSRHIHWKTSARLGKLHEKVFEPSSRQKVLIVIEAGQFSKESRRNFFEIVLQASASLGVNFEKRGIPFGLCSNCKTVSNKGDSYNSIILPATSSSTHLTSFLDSLAGMTTAAGDKTIVDLLHALKLSGGTTMLLFSFYPADDNITLKSISKFFPSPVINITATGSLKTAKNTYSLSDIISCRGGLAE